MKKEIKKIFIVFAILVIVSIDLMQAQRIYYPYFNQYRFEGMVMNPAFAGSREMLSTSLFYKQTLPPIVGFPSFQTITAHTPMQNYKIGLGFLFMHQNVGIEDFNDIYINYAYRINMPIGKISLGLKAGASITSINNTEIKPSIRYGSDPVFDNLPAKETAFLPNFGVGFFYYTRNFFLGGSIPLLLATKTDETTGKLAVTHDFNAYNYIANTGLRLETSANISVVPSFIVLYIKNSPVQYAGNLSFDFFDEFFSIGGGYNSNKSIIGNLQFQANEQLKIGYTYESTFGDQVFNIQTHEIMLRYEFRYVIKASNPVDF